MTKRSVARDATPSRVITASGRQIMPPVRGSKLSAHEIDRAIERIRIEQSEARKKK